MLIGRWSSLAFLKYIRKQVQEFSFGISSKMIEVQTFKHINNPLTTNTTDSIDSSLLLMGYFMEEASSPKDGGGGGTK